MMWVCASKKPGVSERPPPSMTLTWTCFFSIFSGSS